jgi:hypothetical protein
LLSGSNISAGSSAVSESESSAGLKNENHLCSSYSVSDWWNTWEDATAYFEPALKVAVDKSKQRDVNIVSLSPYYDPAAAKQQMGV